MKNSKMAWVLFLITFITINFSGSSKLMAQPGANISFQTFHDELQPYGQWVDDPEDGSIWVPNVERDFRPYATRGHWIVTDYGNTWVSDYDWGWAPFHYGRWRQHSRYGWVWVPGSEWGPAWVSWRSGGGYYGWAPLGPRIDISIGINLPFNLWVFVPQRQLCSPVIYNYYEPRPRIINIYHNTTVINNIYRNNNHNYVYGPRPYEIERATNSRVNIYRVTDAGRPGNTVVRNGSANIYRPQVTGRPDFNNGSNRNAQDNRNASDNRDNRNQDNRNNGGSQDNRSRPDRSNANINSTQDSRRDMPVPSADRNNNSNRSNNIPSDRVQRAQQPDRTPSVEQNAPYQRGNVYAERPDNSSRVNREQQAAQGANQSRQEQPVRREAPQQMQTRSTERTQGRAEQPQQMQSRGQSGNNERTQSRTEQPQQKNGRSSGREGRPGRA